MRYDLLIIGAGSAGFAAARTAGLTGLKVGLIDRPPLGGLCILRGCMPSKAVIRSADVFHLIRNAGELGIDVTEARIDFARVMNRQRDLVKGLADYRLDMLMAQKGFEFIEGHAQFLDPHTVQVGDRQLQADRFIIATGSHPFLPDIPGLRETGFITSDDFFALTDAPKSLIVLGGGVIALELGQFFHRIGVPVTLIHRADHVLSQTDPEVGETLTACLRDEGMTIVNQAEIIEVSRQGDKKSVTVSHKGDRQTYTADEIFLALGRRPNLNRLNLEVAGLNLSTEGTLEVDHTMRSNQPHIYVVGDSSDHHDLVHVAIYQGEIAAYNALHPDQKEVDYRIVPLAIFSDPNFASVGLSEREARAAGRDILTGRYDFADLGKAELNGSLHMKGFVKMIADAATGEILGAQILGPEAAEMIHPLIVAMTYRSTAEEYMRIPHYHPTLTEILTYPAEEIAEKRQGKQAE